jgi:hypothetical protein
MNTDLSTSVAKRQPACLALERYHPRIPASQRTCLYHVSVPLGSHSKTPPDFIRSFYSSCHSYCIYSKMSLRCTPRFQAVRLNKTIFPLSLLTIGSNGMLKDRKIQCSQNESNIFYNREFLGAFTKLRKATVGFAISVRLSVHPHGTTRLPMDGFFVIFYDFSKFCRET